MYIYDLREMYNMPYKKLMVLGTIVLITFVLP